MTTNSTTRARSGQAAVETAIALVGFAFVTVALVSFGRMFVEGLDIFEYARRDAGVAALSSSEGSERLFVPSAVSAAARPSGGTSGDGIRTLPPDPFGYPVRTFPGEQRFIAWRDGALEAAGLVMGAKAEKFAVDLNLFGVPLFEDPFPISETVYLPAAGGGL